MKKIDYTCECPNCGHNVFMEITTGVPAVGKFSRFIAFIPDPKDDDEHIHVNKDYEGPEFEGSEIARIGCEKCRTIIAHSDEEFRQWAQRHGETSPGEVPVFLRKHGKKLTVDQSHEHPGKGEA